MEEEEEETYWSIQIIATENIPEGLPDVVAHAVEPKESSH
jgi:hypothetical protein